MNKELDPLALLTMSPDELKVCYQFALGEVKYIILY
jgi:hypothetical protein